jgi:peptide/nickel transport system permease protein
VRYLIGRAISLVLILVGMAVITFFLARVVPSDPAHLAAGKEARPEQIEAMRKELGLDRPLSVQFWTYLKGLAQGDLGRSLRTRRPVLEDLKLYFPATLELSLVSFVVIVAAAIPLGVITAINAGRVTDYLIRFSVVTAMGIPAFALGLLLQLVFARWLGWLPLEGRLDPLLAPPPQVTGMYTIDSLIARDWTAFRSSVEHLILPVMALALGRLAVAARFTRGSMLEILTRDYIRVARSKGLTEQLVMYRHALRNALLPVITVLGVQIGFLLGGTVLVETVFTWPGLGGYAVTSAVNSDFYSAIGATLVISAMFAVSSTVVDLLYRWIDPRIKL